MLLNLKRRITGPLVFTALLLLGNNFNSHAQCTPLANAIPGISLAYSTGVNNASGVAFNPNFNLYYIAQAGNPGFPLETFDLAGNPLYQTNTGFDMRGLWWNDNTNQLESNGYNAGGIWAYDLNATGYALNTGTSVFAGMNQPTAQSVGDYNCVDDEIWYYDNGSIMKRDRATNNLIGNFPITGLPVGTGNLNNNSVFYTDCQGHEIGLVDYQLKRVYFVDKNTMTYSGMSQLPLATVINNSFRASWANDLVWLFDSGPDIWYSFQVLSGFNTNCTVISCTPPTLVTNDLGVCAPNTVDLNNGIGATSAAGNTTFHGSVPDANAASNPISNIVGVTGMYYVRHEDLTDPTCFSLDSIEVTIHPIYNLNETINACENSTVTYPDGTSAVITASTSYTSNLVTTAGCDSIITTNIVMDPVYNLSENVDICENATVTYPDGSTAIITASTSYTSNLTTVAGCDSIITTNVNMLPTQNSTENFDICQGTDYTYPDGTISTNIQVNESHVSTLTSAQGCDSIVTTNINVNATHALSENINACENSTVTYPDGTTEVITSNSSHISNLTTVAGCDSIVTTNVTMDVLPVAGSNGSVSFCSGDPSADLFQSIGGSPDVGGTWTPALSSGTGVFDPAVDPGGTYTYTINSACGTASADVVVTLTPSDDASFSYSAATYCENDLNPSPLVTGTNGGTFTISSSGSINASTGEIDLATTGAGNYTVTYTTNGPCPDANTVSITIAPQADATIIAIDSMCTYDDSIQLQAATPGGTWSGPGVNPQTGMFDPGTANIGINTITYTIPNPCGDAQTIDIVVSEPPTITSINDTTVNLGATVDLISTSSTTNIGWSPNLWLNCNDCLSPTSTPEETITYTLSAEENGCFASEFVSIIVLYDPVIYVPNIFSPNGDGNNDVLFVRGKGVRSVNFKVYNRWGEKVFESDEMDNGWDGNFRGKPMNPAVFVYYVEATFNNGSSVSKKGDVTLIR